MSPVNDAYTKKGLAAAEQRVAMCELAAKSSPLIMVDDWESRQPQYQYSLHVLQHLQAAVNAACFEAPGCSEEGKLLSWPQPVSHGDCWLVSISVKDLQTWPMLE